MINKEFALKAYNRDGFIPIREVREYSLPRIRQIALKLEELDEQKKALINELKSLNEPEQ